jgi:hypothetical protein
MFLSGLAFEPTHVRLCIILDEAIASASFGILSVSPSLLPPWGWMSACACHVFGYPPTVCLTSFWCMCRDQVNQQLKKRSYKEEEMAARKAARRDVRDGATHV